MADQTRSEQFQDGATFRCDVGRPQPAANRRESLAALRDLVAGKKDWWERKAGAAKTGATKTVKMSAAALPNMAAGGQNRSLLFSLGPQASDAKASDDKLDGLSLQHAGSDTLGQAADQQKEVPAATVVPPAAESCTASNCTAAAAGAVTAAAAVQEDASKTQAAADLISIKKVSNVGGVAVADLATGESPNPHEASLADLLPLVHDSAAASATSVAATAVPTTDVKGGQAGSSPRESGAVLAASQGIEQGVVADVGQTAAVATATATSATTATATTAATTTADANAADAVVDNATTTADASATTEATASNAGIDNATTRVASLSIAAAMSAASLEPQSSGVDRVQTATSPPVGLVQPPAEVATPNGVAADFTEPAPSAAQPCCAAGDAPMVDKMPHGTPAAACVTVSDRPEEASMATEQVITSPEAAGAVIAVDTQPTVDADNVATTAAAAAAALALKPTASAATAPEQAHAADACRPAGATVQPAVISAEAVSSVAVASEAVDFSPTEAVGSAATTEPMESCPDEAIPGTAVVAVDSCPSAYTTEPMASCPTEVIPATTVIAAEDVTGVSNVPDVGSPAAAVAAEMDVSMVVVEAQAPSATVTTASAVVDVSLVVIEVEAHSTTVAAMAVKAASATVPAVDAEVPSATVAAMEVETPSATIATLDVSIAVIGAEAQSATVAAIFVEAPSATAAAIDAEAPYATSVPREVEAPSATVAALDVTITEVGAAAPSATFAPMDVETPSATVAAMEVEVPSATIPSAAAAPEMSEANADVTSFECPKAADPNMEVAMATVVNDQESSVASQSSSCPAADMEASVVTAVECMEVEAQINSIYGGAAVATDPATRVDQTEVGQAEAAEPRTTQPEVVEPNTLQVETAPVSVLVALAGKSFPVTDGKAEEVPPSGGATEPELLPATAAGADEPEAMDVELPDACAPEPVVPAPAAPVPLVPTALEPVATAVAPTTPATAPVVPVSVAPTAPAPAGAPVSPAPAASTAPEPAVVLVEPVPTAPDVPASMLQEAAEVVAATAASVAPVASVEVMVASDGTTPALHEAIASASAGAHASAGATAGADAVAGADATAEAVALPSAAADPMPVSADATAEAVATVAATAYMLSDEPAVADKPEEKAVNTEDASGLEGGDAMDVDDVADMVQPASPPTLRAPPTFATAPAACPVSPPIQGFKSAAAAAAAFALTDGSDPNAPSPFVFPGDAEPNTSSFAPAACPISPPIQGFKSAAAAAAAFALTDGADPNAPAPFAFPDAADSNPSSSAPAGCPGSPPIQGVNSATSASAAFVLAVGANLNAPGLLQEDGQAATQEAAGQPAQQLQPSILPTAAATAGGGAEMERYSPVLAAMLTFQQTPTVEACVLAGGFLPTPTAAQSVLASPPLKGFASAAAAAAAFAGGQGIEGCALEGGAGAPHGTDCRPQGAAPAAALVAVAPSVAPPLLFAMDSVATQPPSVQLAELAGTTEHTTTMAAFGDLMLLDMEGCGYGDDDQDGFGGFGGVELPILHSTPSPVKSKTPHSHVQAMTGMESIPLFVRDSYAPDAHDMLDRQSLADVMPFSKRKLQLQELMSPLPEDTSEPMQMSPINAKFADPTAPASKQTSAAATVASTPGASQNQKPASALSLVAASASNLKAATATAPVSARKGGVFGSVSAAAAAGSPSSGSKSGGPSSRRSSLSASGSSLLDAPLSQQTQQTKGTAATPHFTPGGRKSSSTGGGGVPASAARPHGASMPSRTGSTFSSKAPVTPKAAPTPSQLRQQQLHVTNSFGSPALLFDTTAPSPSQIYSPIPSQAHAEHLHAPATAANRSGVKGTPAAVAKAIARTPLPATHSRAAAAPPHADRAPAPAAGGSQPNGITPGGVQGVMPYAPAAWSTPMARMAALPFEAALHAPLMDSSPFTMEGDDWSGDTMCIAEEAKRLMNALEGTCSTPGNHAGAIQAPGAHVSVSPSSVQMMDMQIQMLVSSLAAAERRSSAAEKSTEELRDQINTMQFEKSMMMNDGDSDRMERDARLCAEELLAVARVQNSALESEVRSQSRALAESQSALETAAAELSRERDAHAEEKQRLEAQLAKTVSECNSMSAHADSLDARLMGKQGECQELQQKLAAESERCAELQQRLTTKEAECSSAQQSADAAKSKLQRALETLTATQVLNSKQHTEDVSKLASTSAFLSRVQTEREILGKELVDARTTMAQSEAHAVQMREKLAASKKENGELMAMCHQLLEQVEREKLKSAK